MVRDPEALWERKIPKQLYNVIWIVQRCTHRREMVGLGD